jgi:hypothetical protein
VRIISGDAPKFAWRNFHQATGNPRANTSGGSAFQEFLVAFSNCFMRTYLSLNTAHWTVTVMSTNNTGWQDSGSGVTGDTSLQGVGGDKVQVLGLSYGKQNTIKHQPQ